MKVFLISITVAIVLSMALWWGRYNTTVGIGANDINEPRPIKMHESLWMEELTWMEIRDYINSGYTTVILPTGGIEQNGPHVITGKHNKIAGKISEVIALKLGKTLIAPVVGFVPQGSHNPPTGHMQYPGTFGVTEKTYKKLITELCLSLKLHGFQSIVLLGDSGGNQNGLETVARKLNKKWSKSESHVIYARDYYFEDKWSYDFLKSLDILQVPDVMSAQRGSVHSDYHYESILASINPDFIRATERQEQGDYSINGVSLLPMETTIINGNKLIDFRAELTVDSIKRERARFALSHQ